MLGIHKPKMINVGIIDQRVHINHRQHW